MGLKISLQIKLNGYFKANFKQIIDLIEQHKIFQQTI